jgi:hypothetical protein|tara:strand:+ start:148 stop:327 length:180 start_codon:yes stop_codon:yes gene_type:complete
MKFFSDGMDECTEQRVGHTNWAFGISTEIDYLAERRGQEIAEVIILFKDDLTDKQKEDL